MSYVGRVCGDRVASWLAGQVPDSEEVGSAAAALATRDLGDTHLLPSGHPHTPYPGHLPYILPLNPSIIFL